MVESLLASAELVVTQLDALAFGQGPGAFTAVPPGVPVAIRSPGPRSWSRESSVRVSQGL